MRQLFRKYRLLVQHCLNEVTLKTTDGRFTCTPFRMKRMLHVSPYHVFNMARILSLAITSPHTFLHWKQYVICCHIAHNNEIFIILTRDFSKGQYVLPDDDIAMCYRNT